MTMTTMSVEGVRLALDQHPDRDDVHLPKDTVRALLASLDVGKLDADRQTLGKINNSFACMPYGGLALFTYANGLGDLLTLDDIAANLDRLRTALEEVAADQDAERIELSRYRHLATCARQLAAFFTEAPDAD